MQYISTRGHASDVSFIETLLSGLAPDGGLFVPVFWPFLPRFDPELYASQSYQDTALQVLSLFIQNEIEPDVLETIISQTYSDTVFSHPEITPLTSIGDNQYLLELFHGPTLAFKDIALQLLGRLFDHVLEKKGQTVTIIGATSGDTGSAAIEAFKNRKNISITILHPKGRTSEIQRRQMTSVMADNVHNIAIEGTFDDCQNLVKQCFADEDLRRQKNLSAVNSINWARIIAQTVYYIETVRKLGTATRFSVPTGNFGNIYAGWVAKQIGGDIGGLVIGSNRNDILTRFFETGAMDIQAVHASHSPSMDIQISSNFERFLFDCLGRDSLRLNSLMSDFKDKQHYKVEDGTLEGAKNEFSAVRCSDEDTISTIKETFDQTGLIIDPHTAVGVYAMNQIRQQMRDEDQNSMPFVSLACAHPAKFPDVIEKAIGIKPALPEHLSDLMDRKEDYQVMANDFSLLKDFLIGV